MVKLFPRTGAARLAAPGTAPGARLLGRQNDLTAIGKFQIT
jgi:hypothetical protein